jgi:ribonuclease HII
MITPDFSYEKTLLKGGLQVIAGVDEAGTGALAGPVVAAAAIVPINSRLGLLRDSKLLSPAQRERAFFLFAKKEIVFSLGVVEIEEINRMNIRQAAILAMRRAVLSLPNSPDALLIDAWTIPGLALKQIAVVHGDQLVKSIAAASIAAKVTRDRMMQTLDQEFPEYGFSINKGYGTAKHLEALREFGPTTAHRLAFRPVQKCLTSRPFKD